MDPAQTSKLKAKVPLKDKMKNLKNRLPGMKKQAGGDDEGHEDGYEYDNDSPRSPGPETRYNASDSTPFTTVNTTPASQDSYSPQSNERTSPREVQNRDYDSRPSQINPPGYDTQSRNHVATAAPTRPAPMPADSPRSNLAPSMEEKFKYLDVGEKAPGAVNPQTVRTYQPEQQYSPSVTNRQTDPIRSYQPEQQYSPSVTNPQADPIRNYQPEQQYSPSVTNRQTDPIRSYQPEQQYSPSVTNLQTNPIRSYQPEQQYSPSVTNPQADPIRNYQPEQQFSPSVTNRQMDPIRSYQPEQQFSPSVTNPQLDPIRSYQPEQQFSPSVTNPEADPVRSYQPEQQYSPSVTNPQADPIRSYQPEQQFSPSVTNPQTDPIRNYQPEQQFSPSVINPQTDPIRSDRPEQQYSPSTIESIQKGYSDGPRSSYRASRTAPPNKGMVDKVKESVAGAAAVVGDRMGYYSDNRPTARDPNAPSILDKAKSTLGLNKPRDPNAPSIVNVAGQKTREYGATAGDHAAWAKDRVATHTTPTHHDKALSEQVTQTLSALPGVIHGKVFGRTSSSANTANSPKTPGIADRVSGAVSSLFTSAPNSTGERLQHTFPAQSDYHGKPAAASVPQNFADRSSAGERMQATPTPAYAPSYPMVNN